MFAQNNTTSGTNLPSNNPHTKLNKPVLLSTSPTSPANPSHHYQNLLVAALAEFAGTFMFLFFAFGGTSVANNSDAALDADLTNKFGGIAQAPDTSVLLYVSLVFGFSLMVNVWVFFRVSGGLFNPAVSCCHLLF